MKEYTEGEIRQQAKEFFEKWFPKYVIVKCDLCGADNCVYNDNCIRCNKDFQGEFNHLRPI
jgi:hypothetical protein